MSYSQFTSDLIVWVVLLGWRGNLHRGQAMYTIRRVLPHEKFNEASLTWNPSVFVICNQQHHGLQKRWNHAAQRVPFSITWIHRTHTSSRCAKIRMLAYCPFRAKRSGPRTMPFPCVHRQNFAFPSPELIAGLVIGIQTPDGFRCFYCSLLMVSLGSKERIGIRHESVYRDQSVGFDLLLELRRIGSQPFIHFMIWCSQDYRIQVQREHQDLSPLGLVDGYARSRGCHSRDLELMFVFWNRLSSAQTSFSAINPYRQPVDCTSSSTTRDNSAATFGLGEIRP